MLNSSAIQREFQPRYSFSWYLSKLLTLVIVGAYITSKLSGENLNRYIEFLGIGALVMAVYSNTSTIKTFEFGTKVKLRYVLWPAKAFDYKEILEIRLPEIVIDARNPIKLDNIVNLDELQQEFKSLELMGVIPRGRIKELQPPPAKYHLKPKLGNMIWALLTALMLGRDLFEISQEANLPWIGIIAVFFASEIFSRLFRKPKDE